MSETNKIRETRAFADRLRASLPTEVDVVALGVKSKAPYQLLCTREALIWRTEELARNACDALERSDFAAAALLARAVTENAALAWKLMDLLETRKDNTPKELSDDLMQALVGWSGAAELPKAFRVGKLVQRMDRVVEGVYHAYGSLSEIAHPNWTGVLALYARTDRKKYATTFGRGLQNSDRYASMIADALLGSLGAFEYAYNKISDGLPAFLTELEGLWSKP